MRNGFLVSMGALIAGAGLALAQAPAALPDAKFAVASANLAEENQALRNELEEMKRKLADAQAKLHQSAPAEPPGAAKQVADPVPAPAAAALATPFEPLDLSHEPAHACEHEDLPPPDLTLWNFFTAGWNEDFTRRNSEGRAPDLALLRVQTNFMEREVRTNLAYTRNLTSPTRDNLLNGDALIAWAFNRRLMIEVLGNYQWVDGRGKSPDISGEAERFIGRVQLISTQDSSYSLNLQAITPNIPLGVHTTTLSYGVAGFEDLTRFGLYRVGFYSSVFFDSLTGPQAAGVTHTDVQYDVTLAKTLTRPDLPWLGNFTVFVENFAQTNIDGDHNGSTLVSITPGVRFNLGKIPGLKIGIDNWLMGGVDIPVAGPKPWDAIYRFTYIKNF